MKFSGILIALITTIVVVKGNWLAALQPAILGFGGALMAALSQEEVTDMDVHQLDWSGLRKWIPFLKKTAEPKTAASQPAAEEKKKKEVKTKVKKERKKKTVVTDASGMIDEAVEKIIDQE